MNTQHPIPDIISQHLAAYHIQTLAPAWIELTPQTDQIQSLGGAWQSYFTTNLELGSSITSACEYLQGMLPIQESFELPQVQMRNDKYTDILAFHDAQTQTDWLLFCDVTMSTLQLQEYQQAANELNLLKDQLNQTLGRFVGEEVAQRASNGTLQFNIAGERKVITTLFVDIRGFTPFNESHDAQDVMHALNQYMDCMLKPILEEAGMVDKIIGDGVMAVFGVLASDNNSADNAFVAAKSIQAKVKALNKQRGNEGQDQLGVGIGIATGDAVLGILGSHERRAFTAIGRHVNLAARLESNARIGEILLDEASVTALDNPPSFALVSLTLKGIGKTHAYSLTS